VARVRELATLGTSRRRPDCGGGDSAGCSTPVQVLVPYRPQSAIDYAQVLTELTERLGLRRSRRLLLTGVLFAQPRECVAGVRLDGSHGDVERRGRVSFGEVVEVPQHKHRALLR
jgi:hypothetical protein